MTPYQHYFPYFVDLVSLTESLLPFQLTAMEQNQVDGQSPHALAIGRVESMEDEKVFREVIRIQHGDTYMVHGNCLFAWHRYQDGLAIQKYKLDAIDIAGSLQEDFINVLELSPGRHGHSNDMSYQHLFTFIRKNNLPRAAEFHEQYVIVWLHEQSVQIISFDSFNETGGDPMYMWPAVACVDLDEGKLHGAGMRMGSFSIQINIDGGKYLS